MFFNSDLPGCVSFVVGLVLIPFILVTVLGAVISCCRPNLVTSFLLPIPVFLLSLVLFGLYASVVATTCTSSLTINHHKPIRGLFFSNG